MSNARPLARRLARGALGLAWLASLGAAGSLLVPAAPAGARGMAPASGPSRAQALLAEARGRFHGVLPPDASPPGPALLDHRLPEWAGAVRVADRASGLWAESALIGARPARGERQGSVMVYEGALGEGAHLFVRATGESVEDFVLLPERPASPELLFSLSLSPEVAGLRLVSGTLELLDPGGAPRLRVAPPYLVDAAGTRHEAGLSLDGCSADRDPSPPWGRPVTPPGASSCTLRVRWSEEGVSYPALVDPKWQPTGAMTAARAFHTQSLLPSGKILVTGGVSKIGDPPLASAELFDPVSKSWAATAPMGEGRVAHTATVVGGKVIVAGGYVAGGASLTSAEIFDGSAFSPLPPMGAARAFHTAVALSGRVMVMGGLDGQSSLSSVEVFDPLSGKWTGAAPMLKARSHHHAALLEGGVFAGRVLVAGGENNGGLVKEAEVFNPDAPDLSQAWTLAGSPPGRVFASLTPLTSGKALFAGGCDQPSPGNPPANPFSCPSPSQDVQQFVPPQTWTGNVANLQQPLWGHGAVRTRDGAVLFAGGQTPTTVASSVERFDPTNNTITFYQLANKLGAPHRSGTIGLTSWGAVLVAGGITELTTATAVAELLTLLPDGAICKQGTDCASGFCTEPDGNGDGVCCNAACDGPCQTCRQQGPTQDGACHFANPGENPGNRCVDQTAAACGTKASCDAGGKCATYLGEACGDVSCVGGEIYTPVCSALGPGGCKNKQTACTPYAGCAADKVTCASSCKVPSECSPGNTCKNGQCVPFADLGSPCEKPGDCQSNNCVDKVCCSEACDQACQSCRAEQKANGVETGICGPAAAGTNPGKRCQNKCTEGSFVEQSCSGTSDGDAACTGTPVPCGAAKCTATGCGGTSCTSDDQCAPNLAGCIGGTCKLLLGKGGACASTQECKGGLLCVEGVCCDEACEGPCMSCKAELKQSGADSGTCGPKKQGTKVDACQGDGSLCAGECNGKGACAFPPDGATCAPDECSPNNRQVVSHVCNGAGACQTVPSSCDGSLVCSGGQCLQKCATNANCAEGTSCTSDGRCISVGCLSPGRYRTVSGENDCLPGRLCIDNDPTACTARGCQSSADCLPGSGLVCRLDGTCAPPLAEPSSEPDCGCRLPGGAPPAGPAAPLALLALALAARQRRARR